MNHFLLWSILLVGTVLTVESLILVNHGVQELFAPETSPIYLDVIMLLVGMYLVLVRGMSLWGKLF